MHTSITGRLYALICLIHSMAHTAHTNAVKRGFVAVMAKSDKIRTALGEVRLQAIEDREAARQAFERRVADLELEHEESQRAILMRHHAEQSTLTTKLHGLSTQAFNLNKEHASLAA